MKTDKDRGGDRGDRGDRGGDRGDRGGDRGDRGGDRGDRGGDRGDRGGDRGEGQRRSFMRSRGCPFCANKDFILDYKNKSMLQQFITERCKIVPRRISNVCASHQRQLTRVIKRARHVAFLSYTTAQV